MRLQVRRLPDGRGWALTDTRGVLLPGQTQVLTSRSEVGALPRVTVEFVVDGRDLEISDEAVHEPGSLAEASAAYAALSEAHRRRFEAMYGLYTQQEFSRRAAEYRARLADEAQADGVQ